VVNVRIAGFFRENSMKSNDDEINYTDLSAEGLTQHFFEVKASSLSREIKLSRIKNIFAAMTQKAIEGNDPENVIHTALLSLSQQEVCGEREQNLVAPLRLAAKKSLARIDLWTVIQPKNDSKELTRHIANLNATRSDIYQRFVLSALLEHMNDLATANKLISTPALEAVLTDLQSDSSQFNLPRAMDDIQILTDSLLEKINPHRPADQRQANAPSEQILEAVVPKEVNRRMIIEKRLYGNHDYGQMVI
jgi:hypothetical protein